MSLESKIDKLIAAVEANTAVHLSGGTVAAPAVESAPAAPVAPAAVAPAAPVAPQVTAPTPAAPAVAHAPAVAASTAPFADHQGLMTYIMGKYQSLGAEKGGQIQTILVNLGFNNINDVTADKYGDLHSQVEAIQ